MPYRVVWHLRKGFKETCPSFFKVQEDTNRKWFRIIDKYLLDHCFSTSVRPRPGKAFFQKTTARSKQIYSSVPFQYFLSSYIKLTYVLIINYGIIIKSISTLAYTVWHVDKYKITFKLVINSRRISRGPVQLMPGPGPGPRSGGWETLV